MYKYLLKTLKGANQAMTREYLTPDFDVTVYEIEDVITVSVGENDPDGSDTSWWG